MTDNRKIHKIFPARPTSDGAGVRLSRIFGFYEEGQLDPFLLLDFFGSDKSDDYIAGFPWHPHRGIETVTYMLHGRVEHEDSMGNKGIIGSGDLQWMTAGSGIIHQEMPKADSEKMFGFQLWVNLPKTHKMMKPRYQDIPADKIQEVINEQNVSVRVIAGEYEGIHGPVTDIIAEPAYLDINIPQNTEFSIDVEPEHTVFAFIFEGKSAFEPDNPVLIKNGNGVLFTKGSKIFMKTEETHVRMILISGKPINEPVAWRGPIVMNTEEELALAFREFREGSFIK
jgi:quercetin 2,3-dioxygenase